jgi:hypothetical protein
MVSRSDASARHGQLYRLVSLLPACISFRLNMSLTMPRGGALLLSQ